MPFFLLQCAWSVYETLPGRLAGAGAALLGRPGEQGQVLRLRISLQHRQGAFRNETVSYDSALAYSGIDGSSRPQYNMCNGTWYTGNEHGWQ